MQVRQTSITPSNLLLHPDKTIQCRCGKQASPLPACSRIPPKLFNAGAKPPRAGQNLFLDLEPEVKIISRRKVYPCRVLRCMLHCMIPTAQTSCDLFLSLSPSVNNRQHTSEVHARAASGIKSLTDSQASFPPPPLLLHNSKRRLRTF